MRRQAKGGEGMGRLERVHAERKRGKGGRGEDRGADESK